MSKFNELDELFGEIDAGLRKKVHFYPIMKDIDNLREKFFDELEKRQSRLKQGA